MSHFDSVETHQQRHDEFVQVNHLNAAYAQLHSAVSFAGVGVTRALCGIRSQTHGKAEHLITHDGDGLKDKKSQQPLFNRNSEAENKVNPG